MELKARFGFPCSNWDRGYELKGLQKLESIRTSCSKKQSVNKEIWEPLFTIERLKQANVFRSMFVYIYTRCAERTLLRIEQVCCGTEFLSGKGFFYKHTRALAVLLKRKYCLRALIHKFRLEACTMKKPKILKLCQNKGLGKVFLEK